MNRVPVIAVTGYLGAGKTALLNHLLRTPGARLGVIVNDFGELNVDAALVEGLVDEVASISGGCLCCLPDSGGLDEALERLSHPHLRLDAILIEASGAADPLALARVIRFSGAEHVRPGGLIEVIDAVQHFRTVDVHPTPPARHRAATLVVIGKSDLLPEGDRDRVLARIERRVRARNPDVHLVVAKNGRVDPDLLFDVLAEGEVQDRLPFAEGLRDMDPDHGEHHHEHAAAVSRELAGPLSPSALLDLLQSPPPGVYRMKGRVRVRGPRGDRGYLANLVGGSIHISPLPQPPCFGELVAVGMSLDVAQVGAHLDEVLRAPADRPDVAGLRRLFRYVRLSR
ncbi:CobW family GTP-binding protein [Tessaracoccus caeni]|uniref:CobW family GTP-binding protein n=1 Tax=Tessaracoccus caeni TaxID=3031239 RepID=UPI0023D9FCAB|nr:GTP-binding protein [Tessaracoccus caeni]MDF1489161.1 GTP-binding protein [Tessaracoccus caeni]